MRPMTSRIMPASGWVELLGAGRGVAHYTRLLDKMMALITPGCKPPWTTADQVCCRRRIWPCSLTGFGYVMMQINQPQRPSREG